MVIQELCTFIFLPCFILVLWRYFFYIAVKIMFPVRNERFALDELCVKAINKKNHILILFNIVSWHLLGHAIKPVPCFDLQFWRITRPMTSFCIFIKHINTEGIFSTSKLKDDLCIFVIGQLKENKYMIYFEMVLRLQ